MCSQDVSSPEQIKRMSCSVELESQLRISQPAAAVMSDMEFEEPVYAPSKVMKLDNMLRILTIIMEAAIVFSEAGIS